MHRVTGFLSPTCPFSQSRCLRGWPIDIQLGQSGVKDQHNTPLLVPHQATTAAGPQPWLLSTGPTSNLGPGHAISGRGFGKWRHSRLHIVQPLQRHRVRTGPGSCLCGFLCRRGNNGTRTSHPTLPQPLGKGLWYWTSSHHHLSQDADTHSSCCFVWTDIQKTSSLISMLLISMDIP